MNFNWGDQGEICFDFLLSFKPAFVSWPKFDLSVRLNEVIMNKLVPRKIKINCFQI